MKSENFGGNAQLWWDHFNRQQWKTTIGSLASLKGHNEYHIGKYAFRSKVFQSRAFQREIVVFESQQYWIWSHRWLSGIDGKRAGGEGDHLHNLYSHWNICPSVEPTPIIFNNVLRMMYTWIFYQDLQLNSESNQTQNKGVQRKNSKLLVKNSE